MKPAQTDRQGSASPPSGPLREGSSEVNLGTGSDQEVNPSSSTITNNSSNWRKDINNHFMSILSGDKKSKLIQFFALPTLPSPSPSIGCCRPPQIIFYVLYIEYIEYMNNNWA